MRREEVVSSQQRLTAYRETMPATGQAEWTMAKDPPKPEHLLDPVEALVHICAIVEAAADELYGTEAEPNVLEIKSIPRRRFCRAHPHASSDGDHTLTL